MASAATTMLERWPHRRMLLALLVVSLVLNVCVVAGVAWTRFHASPPAGGSERFLQRVPAELGLDDKQRGAFGRYVAAMRARTEKTRQQVAPLLGGAWEEVAKPQADAGQVMRLFETAAAKRQESQREVIARTLEFLSTLSPEQRRKFVALAREHRGARRNR
jgi:uncharacterized membrane protein